MQNLSDTHHTAIAARIKRVHTAGPLHSPESLAAQDALVALVAEIAADAHDDGRSEALSEMMVAVEIVGLPTARSVERGAA